MFQRTVARDAAPLKSRGQHAFGAPQWLALAGVAALCAMIFSYVARMLGWPEFPGSCGSILAGALPAGGIATAVVAMFLCIILATLLLGRLEYEIGLFAACIGLAALAVRGGTAGALLRTAGHPQVYRIELFETVLLLVVTGLGWQLLSLLSKFGWLAPEMTEPAGDGKGVLPRQIMAALVQAIVTGLLMFLLARSNNMKQVMAAVAIASVLGSIAAHQSFPVRPSVPFWVGPFLTGIAGYGWAVASPGQWAIGLPANPLAAATPLQYASVGTAGAIMGYWASRQWRAGANESESSNSTL